MSLEATGASLAGDIRPARRRFVAFAIDAVGYGLASARALAVDEGLLSLLARQFGVHYRAAAALSFSAGLIVAYTLSTAVVFKGRAKYGAGGEFLGFLVTGLAGLALNQLLLFAFVDGLHIPVEYAKAPTAGFVFTFNFLSRRFLLFRPAQG